MLAIHRGDERQSMPRILYDKDGNEIEVPDDKELENLVAADNANKNKKVLLKDIMEKLGVEKPEEIAEVLNPNSKNFSQLRGVVKSLKAQLKEKGIEVSEDGKSLTNKNMTNEDLDKKIRGETTKSLVEARTIEVLGRIVDENTRKAVKSYYDQLTIGKEISLQNVNSFLADAVKLGSPAGGVDNIRIAHASSGHGGITSQGESKTSFADTDEGKTLAKEMGLKIGEDKK